MPPSPPPSTFIAGVAHAHGRLVGCSVCADVNGNGGCDGGEPTSITNSTGGYTIALTNAQLAAMTMEAGLVRLQSGSVGCEDMYTGLPQRTHMVTSSGGTAINPLSTLPALLPASGPVGMGPGTSSGGTFVAPPTGAAFAARQAGPPARTDDRNRRHLQTLTTSYSFNDRMVLIRNGLNMNQSFALATIDLTTYDVHGAINTGQDYCLSGSLLVRNSQIASLVLQAATVGIYLFPTSTFQIEAEHVAGDIAGFVATQGISQLSDPFVYRNGSLFPPIPTASMAPATVSAIDDAMASSFTLQNMWMPNCPPLETWENVLLNLHNTRRAEHCAQPLVWDETLASAAATHAATCPTTMDTRSSPLVNENIVISPMAAGPAEVAVGQLFSTWYDAQEPVYDYDIGNTTSTRVTEFTQLLWQTHDVMGCALQTCGLSSVLVCQYASRGCTGSSCLGNTAGNYVANVRRQNYQGPGPCLRRAWDETINATAAAWVGQSYVPSMVNDLLNGTMSLTAFIAATTPAELARQAANVFLPVHMAMPPSPPRPPASTFPSMPQMPLGQIGSLQTTDSSAQMASGADGSDMGWVAGLVLGLMIPMLLCCVGSVVLYRISGGEPGVWVKVHYSHGNPKVSFNYATVEEREKAADDLAIYQKAMSDAMAAYSSPVMAYWRMRADHKNFLRAGGLSAARENKEYAPPYAEKAGDPTTAEVSIDGGEKQDVEEAPAKLLPNQPSIDAELDLEFAESPEDRNRRIEWIKYFVREGDLQRAFDLGWDGKPFKQAAVVRSPADGTSSPKPEGDVPAPAADVPESSAASTADEGGGTGAGSSTPEAAGPLHRI